MCFDCGMWRDITNRCLGYRSSDAQSEKYLCKTRDLPAETCQITHEESL